MVARPSLDPGRARLRPSPCTWVARAGLWATFLFVAAGASACGGSGLRGSVYVDGRLSFRVGSVPATWTPLDVHEASIAFRDDPHAASVLVNARCGPLDINTPLRALTQQLVMGTTERQYALEQVSPFDGREALHTRLFAKLDGVPMAYDIYVTSKDGCTFDFVYVGEPSRFEGGLPGFEGFVSGFHTLRTPALS